MSAKPSSPTTALAALAAVLIGGAVGSSLRLGVDLALPHADDALPLGTLLVNVAGSFALGFLVARAWSTAPAWLRAGLGPGLLGSFTTFSAVAVSAVQLTTLGAGLLAVAYVGASVVGGLAAAALGIRLGAGPRLRIPQIGPDE